MTKEDKYKLCQKCARASHIINEQASMTNLNIVILCDHEDDSNNTQKILDLAEDKEIAFECVGYNEKGFIYREKSYLNRMAF